MTQIFFSWDFIHRMTRNLFGGFLLRRLFTDFRRGDLYGRCRYPLRLKKVPQISQIYTDFSWDVIFVTQISQMTQIFFIGDFFIGRHGIYSEVDCCGDYSRISRRRPVRSLQIPLEVEKSPTDFTDLHRFFLGRYFCHADFADDADFFHRGFFSSDFTEFIRRFPAEAITHGFSRRRPVRSVQIPPEKWTKRFNRDSIKNLCISVKSVGQNNPHEKKSASSAKSA